jgi:hypothetical protein
MRDNRTFVAKHPKLIVYGVLAIAALLILGAGLFLWRDLSQGRYLKTAFLVSLAVAGAIRSARRRKRATST